MTQNASATSVSWDGFKRKRSSSKSRPSAMRLKGVAVQLRVLFCPSPAMLPMPGSRHTVPFASMLQWYLQRRRWNGQHTVAWPRPGAHGRQALQPRRFRWIVGGKPVPYSNVMTPGSPPTQLPRVPYLESEGATLVPA